MTLSNSPVSEKLKVRITIAGFYKLGEGEAKKLLCVIAKFECNMAASSKGRYHT